MIEWESFECLIACYSREDNWCILNFMKMLHGAFLQYYYSEISQTWYSENTYQNLFIHTTLTDVDHDPRSLSW